MYEQEKKRATHLLILLVYTFLTIALTGESLLLGWEMGAIVLTTFMFITVFSIGFSMGKNLSVMMLRQQGSKTSITLEQPEKKQVEQAKQAKYLETAGIKIPVVISRSFF